MRGHCMYLRKFMELIKSTVSTIQQQYRINFFTFGDNLPPAGKAMATIRYLDSSKIKIKEGPMDNSRLR